jgi:predicted secreted protein
MSLVSFTAVFFATWWVVLFAVLPFSVRTQEDDHDVTLGTVPSAPRGPHMLRAVVRTTIATMVLMGILWADEGLGRADDLPNRPGRARRTAMSAWSGCERVIFVSGAVRLCLCSATNRVDGGCKQHQTQESERVPSRAESPVIRRQRVTALLGPNVPKNSRVGR